MTRASAVARAVLYFLLLIGLQGALSSLLNPHGFTAPDLFLLTAAGVALRLRPLPAVGAAYGVGLLQDVLGHGFLGLHAAGLAGAALLAAVVRRQLTDNGTLQTILTALIAILGQWSVFLILTYWLRGGLVTVDSLLQVLPWEAGLSVLVSPLWARVLDWGLGPRPSVEEEMET